MNVHQEERRINVATALNDAYVPYTYVMLLSLFRHNKVNNVFLLIDELQETAKEQFLQLAKTYGASLSFLQVHRKQLEEGILGSGNWPTEACFRLELLDLLPQDISRVLYLDGDMIINQNLEDFFCSPFETGKHLKVCKDYVLTKDTLDKYGDRYDEKVAEIVNSDSYFNSGMILMDVESLRKQFGLKKYVEIASGLKLYAPDQDLLNCAHYNETEFVNREVFNYFSEAARVEEKGGDDVAREVAVLHFAGGKPWNGSNHINHETETLWWDYAKETPYINTLVDEFINGWFDEDGVRIYNFKVMEIDNENLRKEISQVEDDIQTLLSLFEEKTGQKAPNMTFPELPKKENAPASMTVGDDEKRQLLCSKIDSKIRFIYKKLKSKDLWEYRERLYMEKGMLKDALNKRVAIGLEIKKMVEMF